MDSPKRRDPRRTANSPRAKKKIPARTVYITTRVVESLADWPATDTGMAEVPDHD